MRIVIRFFFVLPFVLFAITYKAQNDLDALRYSQGGVGGSNRFKAMGGAFGAIGADVSCLNYNPAGIGIYRKGEMNFSFGLRFNTSKTLHYGATSEVYSANMVYGNFGIAGSWQSKSHENERHSLGLSSVQLQNFSGSTRYQAYTRQSMANDMLSYTSGKAIGGLSGAYEGLAFNTFLIDTSAGGSNYYSFVDPKKSVLQSREIQTKGRMNETAIGYAYGYKDLFYFGASLGIPSIRYEYTSVHTDSDDKDSMHVKLVSPGTYTTSYSNLPVSAFYTDLLGFKNMSYTEKFSTEGNGYNLKLGFLARVNEYLRFGAYVHTPSFFSLTDRFSYNLKVNWDSGKSTEAGYPDKEGIYKYELITPGRYGASLSFVYKKLLVIGADYEGINYGKAILNSDNPKDFEGVNVVIKNKYKTGHNFRFGGELNLTPVFLRAGYASYGSPFGDVFSGPQVRNIISVGAGLRTRSGLYFDVAYQRQLTKEDYYLLRPSYIAKSQLTNTGTVFAISIGCKF